MIINLKKRFDMSTSKLALIGMMMFSIGFVLILKSLQMLPSGTA